MVKGAEGCSRTGIFNGKPDCKKVSGEGRTYGIFSDHHRRGSVMHSKPDGEIYQKACAALGTDPSQTYGVEDSYNGVRSTSNAGLKTIMVPDLLPPTEEMRERVCTVQPDLLAVKEYLQKEQGKSE